MTIKVRPLSDLHLEASSFTIEADQEDVIILAGDIAIHTDAIRAGQHVARRLGVPIIMIAGNHEFFQDGCHPRHTWESTISDLRAAADHIDTIEPGRVTFLENGEAQYKGVRFIGATLWTDTNLFSDDWLVPLMISRQLIDYEFIRSADAERLSAEHVQHRHHESLNFIQHHLAHPFDGPTVVISHHAPSMLSIAEHHRDDKMSAAFASRLDETIMKYSPDLWIHGHVHHSLDYRLGSTRVLCNPRGYAGRDLNTWFNPGLLIEI